MRIIKSLAAILVFALTVNGAEDTSYCGIRLPLPVNEIWLEDSIVMATAGNEISHELLFYVSSEGCTDSVIISGPFDSTVMEPLWGALKGMDFSPASLNGEPFSIILPAKMEISRVGNSIRVRLRWPAGNIDGLNDAGLLKRVQELNDFEFPVLEMLPPYYCRIEDNFGSDNLAFAVFRLILDSTGGISDIKRVAGNHRQCSDILSSTLLYGQYQPGSYKGQAINSELYLTVCFFQEIGYPTDIWPPLKLGTTSGTFNQLRLEGNPYFPRLASPPVPRNMVDGFLVTREEVRSGDSLSVELIINTRGRAIITRFVSPVLSEREKAVRAIIKELDFRPALDIEARAVYFEGRATLHFNYSKRIRIGLNWLP